MIEILVAYIQERVQDRGYAVHVLPGALLIRKRVSGGIVGLTWAIPQVDLNNAPKEVFFREADEKIQCLFQAEQAKGLLTNG